MICSLLAAVSIGGALDDKKIPWYDVPLPTTPRNDGKKLTSGSRDFTFRYDAPHLDPVQVKVTVDFTYKDLRKIGHWTNLDCNSICDKTTHDGHENCDQSCDDYSHCNHWQTELTAAITPAYGKGALPSIVDGAAMYNKYNMRALRNRIRNEATKEWRDNFDSFRVKVSDKHWNKTPCTWGTKTYVHRKYAISAKYRIFRTQKGRTDEVQYEGEGLIAHVYVPEKDPYKLSMQVQCRCDGMKEHPNQTQLLWRQQKAVPSGGEKEKEKEKPKETKTSYSPSVPSTDSGIPVSSESLRNDYGLVATAFNMNRAEFKFNPTMQVDENIKFSPGFMLVSEDDEYQNMGLVGNIQTQFKFGIPIRGPRQDDNSYEALIQCLNLSKKAPHPGVKFSYRPTANRMVIDLLQYASEQQFYGPWDQARTWIGTDQATLNEINEVLHPQISPAQYVMALYESELAAKVPLASPEWADCLDPAYLAAQGLPESLAVWYARLLVEARPGELAKWLGESGAKLKPVNSSVLGPIVSEIACGGDAELQIALLKAMPAAISDVDSDELDVEQAIGLVTSFDPMVARAAMTMIEKMEPMSARAWLHWLPSDADSQVKRRAAKYLAD